MNYDNVNNPKHYAMANKHLVLEPIDICEKYSFCQGNAIKYLLRYENKNGVEDLKKALWYLNRIINENLTIWYPDGGLDKALIKQYEKSHPIAYMVMDGAIRGAKDAVEEAIAKAAEPLDKAVKTELNKKKKTMPEGWYSLIELFNIFSKVLKKGNTQITYCIYLKALKEYENQPLEDDVLASYLKFMLETVKDYLKTHLESLDDVEYLKIVYTLDVDDIIKSIKE